MTVASKQGKEEFCIALFNRELNANSICPANHDVCYSHGWFYFDGKPRQRPDLTAIADEMIKSGSHRVLYWPEGNTYVIDYNPEFISEEC